MRREDFIAAARKRVGTRFRHAARGPHGLDCIGLVVVCLRECGMEPRDRLDYGSAPDGHSLRDALNAHFGAPVSDWQAGDIALFRWGREPERTPENHVGILFDHPNGGLAVVHSLLQNRRVIEHTLAPQYVARIADVWRPTWGAA